MIVKRGEPVIEFVPWWADAALRVSEGVDVMLAAIDLADMDAIREDPDRSMVEGTPVYVACKAPGAPVHLWPCPDRDYEMVPR